MIIIIIIIVIIKIIIIIISIIIIIIIIILTIIVVVIIINLLSLVCFVYFFSWVWSNSIILFFLIDFIWYFLPKNDSLTSAPKSQLYDNGFTTVITTGRSKINFKKIFILKIGVVIIVYYGKSYKNQN